MSSDPELEEHELESDPELESPDLPELPPDIRTVLLTDFPPRNPRSSGFASTLVDLMTKADKYNLARLFEAFPVYGVAFMMWDAGLIDYAPDRSTVNFKEEHADKASILDIPDWLEKCHILQSMINYSRTLHNGHTIDERDLTRVSHFGSY